MIGSHPFRSQNLSAHFNIHAQCTRDPTPRHVLHRLSATTVLAFCLLCVVFLVQAAEADAALLVSRLEVAQAELEGERAMHRRELRKKAREIQEVRAGGSSSTSFQTCCT